MTKVYYSFNEEQKGVFLQFAKETNKTAPDDKKLSEDYTEFVKNVIVSLSKNGIGGGENLIKQGKITKEEFETESCPEFEKPKGKSLHVIDFANPIISVGLKSLFKYNNILARKDKRPEFSTLYDMIQSFIDNAIESFKTTLLDIQLEQVAKEAKTEVLE